MPAGRLGQSRELQRGSQDSNLEPPVLETDLPLSYCPPGVSRCRPQARVDSGRVAANICSYAVRRTLAQPTSSSAIALIERGARRHGDRPAHRGAPQHRRRLATWPGIQLPPAAGQRHRRLATAGRRLPTPICSACTSGTAASRSPAEARRTLVAGVPGFRVPGASSPRSTAAMRDASSRECAVSQTTRARRPGLHSGRRISHPALPFAFPQHGPGRKHQRPIAA